MFASESLLEHAARGVVGLGALALAATVGAAHPWLALAMIPVGVIALRGCPLCWTLGLVQTLVARWRGRAAPERCVDGSCARSRRGALMGPPFTRVG
jgi:hypothetical protein